MSVRSDFAEFLTPLLPKDWRIVPFNTALDVTDRPVVMLIQKTVERAPEAPIGALKVGFSVLVIQPRTEPGAADDALDDDLMDVALAINKLKHVTFVRAERSTWNDTNPAWDITAEYYASSETEDQS